MAHRVHAQAQLFKNLLLACAVILVVFGSAGAARQAERELRVPPRTILSGTSSELVLEHEVLHDPRQMDSPFYLMENYALAPDGRIYVLDPGDQDVKVLGRDGQHLFTFGGLGEGPGEFRRVWLIDIGHDGRVYVTDGLRATISIFNADGSFIDVVQIPPEFPRQPKSLFVLPSGDVLLAGASLHPDLYGKDIHRFSLVEDHGDFRLTHIESFGHTPDYEPAIYQKVIGGDFAHAPNGGFFYVQNNPYNIRKYGRDFELQWEASEGDFLPTVASYFGFTRQGAIRVAGFPASRGFLNLGDEEWLQVFVLPPRVDPDPSRIGHFLTKPSVAYETLRASSTGRLERTEVFHGGDIAMMHTEVDTDGTLVGIWFFIEENSPVLIRSTVTQRPRSASGRADTQAHEGNTSRGLR